MNSSKKIAQGYLFLKPFNRVYLPTNIQNIIIKNYCEQNDLLLKLSVNEHNIKNCWMELFSLLKKDDTNIIVMMSIYMLPDNKKDFIKFYKLLKKNEKHFVFVFENLKIKNIKELKNEVNKFKLFKELNKFI